MMGAGEGRKLIAGNKTGHTHIAKQKWDIFKTKPKKSTWDFLRKSG